ncbi:MAG: hypothetical protein HC834_07040 [Rhodospirillales bacterium]|nr:hypothetical protein [Rhodospirillales bacterium]
MPFVDFRQLRQELDCREVLTRHGWEPTRREPASWRGPCPFHGSRTPHSRALSVARAGFHCFSCHARGDVIAIYQLVYRLDAYRAALLLAADFGIPTGHTLIV